MTLLTPGQALAAGESKVGGKAWGLARLHDAGAQVPEWTVVPAEFCLAGMEASGLTEILLEKLRSPREIERDRARSSVRSSEIE